MQYMLWDQVLVSDLKGFWDQSLMHVAKIDGSIQVYAPVRGLRLSLIATVSLFSRRRPASLAHAATSSPCISLILKYSTH